MDISKMHENNLKGIVRQKETLIKKKKKIEDELDKVNKELNTISSAEAKLTASYKKLENDFNSYSTLLESLKPVTKQKSKKQPTPFEDGSTAMSQDEKLESGPAYGSYYGDAS